jgi:hypothetical protein
MTKRLSLLCACAALLASCAHTADKSRSAADPETLLTDGVADNNPKNIAATRAEALQDAQKDALRRVIMLYSEVSGASVPAADPLAYGGPQQYIVKHKIISEGVEGAYYRVSVKSWVNHSKLAAAMRAAAPTTKGGGKASLLAKDAQAAGFAKSFKLAMARRGVIAVEDLPAASAKPEDSDEAALAAASAEGADLLLRVSATAAASGAGLNTGFYPSVADAALKVFSVSDGRLQLELSRQGSAIDSSQPASFSKAMASAAELLAQEFSVKADRLVKQDKLVKIKVTGVKGFPGAEGLKADLSKLDVKRLWLESYAEGFAVFVVAPRRPDPQELASSILRGDSFGLELEGASPQEIRFFVTR